MKRLVVLISGRGSNLGAILARCKQEAWPVELVRVVSSHSGASGLELAAAHSIETAVVGHQQFSTRAAFDAALADQIERDGPDLIVLAGFMRILTPEFCKRFEGRLLNIHPSLLPAFTGLNTHQRALDAGVKVHGCTVHSVTAELDHGPILAQGIVPVLPDDTAESLAQRVLEVEHQVYPMAVAAVLSGRCVLRGDRWCDQGTGDFAHAFSPCLGVQSR
jgi:phosphoribosylglycinamide formyltransferase 1